MTWKCPKCGREFNRQNQDHYCIKPQNIDEYIAAQDEKYEPLPVKWTIKKTKHFCHQIRLMAVFMLPSNSCYVSPPVFLIYDPRHIEIQWKFPDEVIEFIEG